MFRRLESSSPLKLNDTNTFNTTTIKRILNLVSIILQDTHNIFLFVLYLFICLFEECIIYFVGIITAGYYKVLGEKDINGFLYHTLKATGLIIAVVFIKTTRDYLTSVQYISWRQKITHHLQKLYLTLKTPYYKLALHSPEVDNPDQRITQDVDKFCNTFSSKLKPILVSPFTIPYYTYFCYNTTGWTGPATVVGYFLLSTLINKLLMTPVIKYVTKQEKYEGDFRYKHMHIRSKAESIALQNGSLCELNQSAKHLKTLLQTQQSLYLSQFPLNFMTSFSSYLGSIVSFLILAVPIFNGQYNKLSGADLSSLISKNTYVTMYLISCFSGLIELSSSFTVIAGTTNRISQLLDSDEMQKGDFKDEINVFEKDIIHRDTFSKNPNILLEIEDVSFSVPGGSLPLLQNFNLIVRQNQNVLITGDSGTGKTSLFRVLKKLWPLSNGTLYFNLKNPFLNPFVLPQKSLLVEGTLRQQVIYPLTSSDDTTDSYQILKYLEYTNLLHLVDRCGGLDGEVQWKWDDILSAGEAQRLSFVRLFYHSPQLALLDEASNALQSPMEAQLYVMCQKLNITLITISHNPLLRNYHSSVLHLHGNSNWDLTKI